MKLTGKLFLYTIGLTLMVGLVFASGVFGLSLYAKARGLDPATLGRTPQPLAEGPGPNRSALVAEATPAPSASPSAAPSPEPTAPAPLKPYVLLDAPIIRQYPELPEGCEITSLAMLLQYDGVQRSKLELANNMALDQTALKLGPDGSIVYWGNPNRGYVGDIYGKSRGFGIYHTAVFPQLKKDEPSAVDLTGKPFESVERQLSGGFPVMAWTTSDYTVPTTWVQWDTDIGPFRTTFAEHAVLVVGYDDHEVFVNDPLSGGKGQAIEKSSFIAAWEAMGRQALSYTKKKE